MPTTTPHRPPYLAFVRRRHRHCHRRLPHYKLQTVATRAALTITQTIYTHRLKLDFKPGKIEVTIQYNAPRAAGQTPTPFPTASWYNRLAASPCHSASCASPSWCVETLGKPHDS